MSNAQASKPVKEANMTQVEEYRSSSSGTSPVVTRVSDSDSASWAGAIILLMLALFVLGVIFFMSYFNQQWYLQNQPAPQVQQQFIPVPISGPQGPPGPAGPIGPGGSNNTQSPLPPAQTASPPVAPPAQDSNQ